jgi:phenylpropionate dioxygenase-like ring-hydroxylating dioxygenase large terminal subunit
VIPATPGFAPPDSHAARGHALAQSHGLLWVRLAGEAGGPPTLAGLPAREVVCGPFDVDTSAPRVVENFLDTAHFGFIHAGFLGDRAHTEVPEHSVTQTADGRPLVEHYRAWQPRANARALEGAWVDYRYELLGPYSALLRKHAGGGALDEAYALWVCPIEPERSHVWFTLFTSDAALSDAALQAFQRTIFAQDQPLLESQRPKCVPIHPQPDGGEVHSAADRLSAAYRRYLRTSGIRFGVC